MNKLMAKKLIIRLSIIGTALSTLSLSAYAAISATTANIIHGNAPTLNSSTHLANVLSGDDFSLMGLDVDGNHYFNNTRVASNLNYCYTKLSDGLKMLGDGVNGNTSLTFKNLNGGTPLDAIDLDGDSFSVSSLQGIGNFNLGWYYSASGIETPVATADLDKTFYELEADGIHPYLVVESPIALLTQYGAPNFTNYDILDPLSPITASLNGNPRVKIDAFNTPLSCYADAASNSSYLSYTLSGQFVKSRGFYSNLSPNKFPTTGFDGASFILRNINTSATDIIAATGSSLSSGSISLDLVAESATDLKVTLHGPKPSSPEVTFTPGGFTIFTTNRETGALIRLYDFNIAKWFTTPANTAYPLIQFTGTTTSADPWEYNGTTRRFEATPPGTSISPASDACEALGNWKLMPAEDFDEIYKNNTYPDNPPQCSGSGANTCYLKNYKGEYKYMGYVQRRIGGLNSEWGAGDDGSFNNVYTESEWYGWKIIGIDFVGDGALGTNHMMVHSLSGTYYDFKGWYSHVLQNQFVPICVSK